MKQVSATDLAKFSKLTFKLTYTKRNEEVALQTVPGDFVIARNGLIYQNGNPKESATVTVIGGDSNFVHQLSVRERGTYISAPQKRTIGFILQQVAERHFNADIYSPDPDLNNIVNTTYFNHMG